MFKDRKDAGWRLALALDKYRSAGVLVLAIPKGGVEVGYEVAKRLDAEFSIIISRKLPYPENPEAGFGAIAEDGSTFIFAHARSSMRKEEIDRISKEQKEEIKRRIGVLRGGRPLPDVEGRTVILVDDGIAMGSTMRASIMLLRKRGAAKIVVASPVSGELTAMEIRRLADEVVIVEQPEHFYAVAQVYDNWYDVPDEEVIEIMKRWESGSNG